jgi:hypothetical protein
MMRGFTTASTGATIYSQQRHPAVGSCSIELSVPLLLDPHSIIFDELDEAAEARGD